MFILSERDSRVIQDMLNISDARGDFVFTSIARHRQDTNNQRCYEFSRPSIVEYSIWNERICVCDTHDEVIKNKSQIKNQNWLRKLMLVNSVASSYEQKIE